MTEQIIKKLYNGEVEVIFNPNSHRYKLKGERKYLVSVTGVTGIVDASRPLMIWAVGLTTQHLRAYLENSSVDKFTKAELLPIIDEAGQQHTIKKETAASIGEQVHNFAEYFAQCKLNNKEAKLPERGENTYEDFKNIMAGINAFLEWYNNNNVKFIESEKIVYSRKNEYIGTMDALAMVNEELTVIDYKTAKRIYSPHRYQVAAYRGAYEEEVEHSCEKDVPSKSLILHFCKETGEFNQLEINQEEHEKDFATFLACLTVKKREKELNKW